MKTIKKYKILLFCFILFHNNSAKTQAPVGPVSDARLAGINTIIVSVEVFSKFLANKEKPLQAVIQNVQEFFSKASTIVNGAVRDLRLVREIVDMQAEIFELYGRSIDALNEPLDRDGDGEDDRHFLDKWKHLQILLALSGESLSVFELFGNVIEQDKTVMGDKARISIIQKTHKELRLIKASMKLQIRRINKEIYIFKRNEKELQVFGHLFS